ncbi:MAG TPA: HlyD family efflux transporter periplasmic adaptor subunit [Chthoniobacteraceae bacterium]|jgi:HlyD family secretion protein
MNTTSTTPAKAAAPRPVSTRRREKPRRFLPYLIGAVVLLLIFLALRPKPLRVEIGKVVSGPLTVSVLEEGKTRIRHRYVISPPVSGYLNRVELRAGDRIEAGKTVLAKIQPQAANFLDPRARAEAEARVKGAEAGRMRAEAEVERVRASLDLARKDAKRADELQRKGAVSAKEWDAARSQAEVLARELRSAEFAGQVAEFELVQAQAALTQAQSPATESATPLEIIAPVDGFVLGVNEESARPLSAGQPIMEVGNTRDIEAEIELLSSDAVGVAPGAEVLIEQWGGEQPLRGKVSVVEPGGYTKISALGVEEQRVKVRVDFVDAIPAGRVLGDRFRVEARIVTWKADKVLQIPTGALFRRGNDWMTFAVDGGKTQLAKVEIAHNNGIAAEVRSGLHESQEVVLHPPDAVTEGSRVAKRGD